MSSTQQTFDQEKRLRLWHQLQAQRGAVKQVSQLAGTGYSTVKGYLTGRIKRTKFPIAEMALRVLNGDISDAAPTLPVYCWCVWVRESHLQFSWLSPKTVEAIEALADYCVGKQLNQDQVYEVAQEIDVPGYTLRRYEKGVAWYKGKLKHSYGIGLKIYLK